MATPRQDIAASRASFCASLRAQREQRNVSLQHIAEVTRIPLRSLELLEAADFEALPGAVFVRGFITAYVNCLDLDSDSVMARFAECEASTRAQPLQMVPTLDDEPLEDANVPEPASMQGSQSRKRVGVTFALILLLIVATLTISYFLRSTDSAGDGVTMLRSALG